MNKFNKILKKLWQDESGQGAMEYILILVVVGALVVAFKDEIVTIIKNKTADMGGKLGTAMDSLQ